MAEVLPGFQASTWFAMVAPPGTPAEILSKLSSAVSEAIHEPDVAKRFVGMSADGVGDTPAEMKDFLRALGQCDPRKRSQTRIVPEDRQRRSECLENC
jgi:tripartite-type tricarboxylate transporter receptor subunit TctC